MHAIAAPAAALCRASRHRPLSFNGNGSQSGLRTMMTRVKSVDECLCPLVPAAASPLPAVGASSEMAWQ